MTLKEDIAAMRLRIAKAESERDRWRSVGKAGEILRGLLQWVEALKLQLDLLRKAARLGTQPHTQAKDSKQAAATGKAT